MFDIAKNDQPKAQYYAIKDLISQNMTQLADARDQ